MGRIKGKQFGGIGDLKKKIDFYIAHSAQTHVFSFRESRPAIAGRFSLAQINEKRRLSVIGKPSFSVMVL